MKTFRAFLYCFLLAGLAMVSDSCKKEEIVDPCENVLCLNGGTCNDGSCQCPPGFSGINCEVQDKCFGITCLNGGVCVNGICDCPEGYTGAFCGDEVTPRSMKLIKIILKDFPATTSSGSGWDFTSGPDVYVELSYNGSVKYTSTYYQNASPGDNLQWNLSNVNLNDPTGRYELRIFDFDDLDADDFMAGLAWTPYQSGFGFPLVENLKIATCEFEVHYQYVF